MIGLSTAWTSPLAKTGEAVLGPILDLGIGAVELEFRITGRLFQEMLPRIRGNAIEILSIHNYFPLPEIIPPAQASGDCFSLSSLDQEEREKGIYYTCRTIERAHDLEARVVVLHLGRVETDLPRNGLQKLYRNGKWESEGAELFRQYQEERRRHRDPHLDALLFSLDPIIKQAEQLGIILGIENRYYLQEMPDKEEIGIILAQFRGGPVGYWHDTGHGAVLETLGILKHEEFLKTLAPSLVGIHLHDCQGVEDHKPPGQGKIDFEMVKRYIPEQAIKTMEIHPPASSQEIMDGLAFLKEKGIV